MRHYLALKFLLAATVAQAMNVSGGGGGSKGVISPTSRGGTGQNWSSIAAGSLPYFSGTGTFNTLPAGTNGKALALSGGVPVWSSPGGDLSGTYVNATVSKLEAVAISLPLGGAVGQRTGLFSNTRNSHSPAVDGSGNIWTVDDSLSPPGWTKWTPAGSPTNFTFGSTVGRATGMAYDGTNMWSCALTGTPGVFKLDPSGTITRFTSGITDNCNALQADSSGNIWTIHQTGTGACVMSKINGSGVQQSSVTVEASTFGQCTSIAYDGVNMWTASGALNRVYKITPALVSTTFAVASLGASGIAFDGTNMWLAAGNSSELIVVDPTGATINTFSVGTTPIGVVWDGTHMWTQENASTNLYRVSAAGSVNTYTTGTNNATTQMQIGAFDNNANIWWSATNGINEVQALLVPSSPLPNMVLVATGPYAAQWGYVTVSTANITPGLNAASELVQLTAAGKYPALDGSLITNISGTGPTSQAANLASGSRVIGTVYHNTGSTAMWVNVSVRLNATTVGASEITVLTDAASTPTTLVAEADNEAVAAGPSATQSVTFVVLPGNFYEVVNASSGSGNVSLITWTEWQ